MREVTDATFGDEVLAADAPVVVDFWAPWCGPCKAIEPVLEALPLDVVKLDIDASPKVASRYGVLSIPAVILFEDGEPRATVLGARPRKHFEKIFAAIDAGTVGGETGIREKGDLQKVTKIPWTEFNDAITRLTVMNKIEAVQQGGKTAEARGARKVLYRRRVKDDSDGELSYVMDPEDRYHDAFAENW